MPPGHPFPVPRTPISGCCHSGWKSRTLNHRQRPGPGGCQDRTAPCCGGTRTPTSLATDTRSGAVQDSLDRFRTARSSPRDHFSPLLATRVSQPLQARDGSVGPWWFADETFIAVRGVYLKDDFDFDAIPANAQIATNYYDGSSYDSESGQIENVAVPAYTDGTLRRLVVVFAYRRATFGVPGNVVSGGRFLLPRIRSVLGAFVESRFDPTSSDLLDQDSRNFFTGQSLQSGHSLVGVDAATGTTVTVVYDDVRLGRSYISGLRVAGGRVFLPFGPQLLAVTAAFRADDVARATDLLAAGAQVRQLSSAEGARLNVQVEVEDYRATESASYVAIFLPAAATGQEVVAVVPDPPSTFDPTNLDLVELLNRLPTSRIRDGFLLFPSDLPAGTWVGLVMEDAAAARSLVDWDDRAYQYIDHPSGDAAYRIVAYRSVMTNQGELILRSQSSLLSPIVPS